MKQLLFHIARGGRFNNPGYVYFEGEKGIKDCPFIMDNEYFYPKLKDDEGNYILDEDGNTIDDDDPNAELLDDVGNGIKLTIGQLENNDGVVELNGEYDTWYTKFTNDLDDDDTYAILAEYQDRIKHNIKIYEDDIELLIEIYENSIYTDTIEEIIKECEDTCDIADNFLKEHGIKSLDNE